jgi:hypothetical protein
LQKKFHAQIIPELMSNKNRQVSFDCSFRKRILFVRKGMVYELNDLDF